MLGVFSKNKASRAQNRHNLHGTYLEFICIPHPFAEPQVQDEVKVDVREQRRYNGPLGRAFFRGPHQTILHDTAFKHPDEQSDDPLIGDAMPQKLDQPLTSASNRWLSLFCWIVRPRASKHWCWLRHGRYRLIPEIEQTEG